MGILHHGPEHCFHYHLIRSLHLINIFMTGVYSGIQWNIYIKPYDIPLPRVGGGGGGGGGEGEGGISKVF